MVRRTGGLGKGLDALIPREEQLSQQGEPLLVPIAQITPNPRQPRTAMDPAELTSLADSIREHGILQPLIVRRATDPDQFFLIAGERRLRAAGLAGLERVPVILRNASDEEQLELALIENIQRADLNPIETAEAYRQLIQDFGLTQEEVARKVGRSRSKVANAMRLLELPIEIRQGIVDGVISEGHGVALLMLKNSTAQLAAYQTVLDRRYTVRETEDHVRKLLGNRPVRRAKSQLPAEITELEGRIRDRLGTRVRLRRSQDGKGSLSLYYYSDEELDALVQRILNE